MCSDGKRDNNGSSRGGEGENEGTSSEMGPEWGPKQVNHRIHVTTSWKSTFGDVQRRDDDEPALRARFLEQENHKRLHSHQSSEGEEQQEYSGEADREEIRPVQLRWRRR